jgi:protocatechuate 3,4-dioxygenase beta subunit
MRLSLLLAVALAASAQAQAPPGAPSTSASSVVITGRVVTDSTGTPIRNGRVTLSPAPPEMPVVLTDGTGAFSITAPAGRHAVVASKTGYARGEATVAGAGKPVEIRLKKGAAIAGRVLDERGDPVAGVQVAALTQTGVGSTRATAASTDTDDRGEYRLAGLSDGAFVVGVTTLAAVGTRPLSSIPRPRTTYYPGAATVDDAQTLRLEPGDERRGTDIIVTAERLTGMPAGLFANRFLPREPSPLVRLGLEKLVSPPTGAVRGRVLDIDGMPIPFAQVYLFTSNNADSRMATTDEDGRFAVEKVVAGTVLLSVVKQRFAQVESGQALRLFQMGRAVTSPSPGATQFGRRIEIASDASGSVDLQMALLGAVSGTVTDENGDPMQGVEVEALRLQYGGGRQRLVPAGVPRITDDRGRYRLYGLAPGRYLVTAAVGQVSSDDVPGYSRAYFPGTAIAAEAQYVSVGFAQDIDFVDVAMSRGNTARVSGIVLSPTGEPTVPGNLTLSASRRSPSVPGLAAVGARIGAEGTFVFPNVPPGEYVIQAYRGRPNAHSEGEFGAAVVTVGTADVTGVIVRTSSGSPVTGRFRFDVDDPTAIPRPSDLELAALPVDFDASPNNAASADIHRDWTFELSGLHGPRRLQLVRTPPGFGLEEIRVNGADVTDRPLPLGTDAQALANVEVVVTDRVTELSGSVVDDRARPVAAASVIVFSTDRQQWYPASRYLRQLAAGPDGVFRVTGLPSGSYFAAAVTAIPIDAEDAWQDPRFLESIVPGAPTIGIASRQRAVVTLRLRGR